MTATKTAGQKMTAHVAKFCSIGGRTRNRRRFEVRDDIIDTIVNAACIPGYFTPERTAEIRPAYAPACGYRNHIVTGRVDAIVCWYVREHLTPYRFIQLLARMVDEGVTTSYEAEVFFNALRPEAYAAHAVRYPR